MVEGDLLKDVYNNTGKSAQCLYICDNVYTIFHFIVTIGAFGILAVVGLVSNLVSMVIYATVGLKDSMSVSLFALSFTDFAASVIQSMMAATYLASEIYPSSPVDLQVIAFVFMGWSLNAGHLISCWLTAFISVERCLCVVTPFRVKQIFTVQRSVIVLLVIYLIHVSTLLPVFISETMQWVSLDDSKNLNSNISNEREMQYTVIFTDFSDAVETAVDITTSMFLFTASQLVLVICSTLLTSALKASSSVRLRSSDSVDSLLHTSKRRSKLSIQEKKLIRMVLSLAVLQMACNVPRLSMIVFYNAYPGIGADDRYFAEVIWAPASVFINIGCTANTFCYYFLNSSYRKVFKHITGQKSK